eukprot:356206-Chlamydomonas_euryale.AAC.2
MQTTRSAGRGDVSPNHQKRINKANVQHIRPRLAQVSARWQSFPSVPGQAQAGLANVAAVKCWCSNTVQRLHECVDIAQTGHGAAPAA